MRHHAAGIPQAHMTLQPNGVLEPSTGSSVPKKTQARNLTRKAKEEERANKFGASLPINSKIVNYNFVNPGNRAASFSNDLNAPAKRNSSAGEKKPSPQARRPSEDGLRNQIKASGKERSSGESLEKSSGGIPSRLLPQGQVSLGVFRSKENNINSGNETHGKKGVSKGVASDGNILRHEKASIMLKEAQKHQKSCNHTKAKEILENALELAPRSYDVLYFLGISNLRLGNLESAREVLFISTSFDES